MRQIILAINALLKFKAYTLINVLGLACGFCLRTHRIPDISTKKIQWNQCFPEYKHICLIKNLYQQW